VDFFNELGYDVMELNMPLYGCNAQSYGHHPHTWFEQYEKKGDHTMRYFIEPVALAVAHAKRAGYKHIVMSGFSGGGWTTHVAAAVIPDIQLSIAVAGSTPKWPTKSYPHWMPDLPEGKNALAKSPDVFDPPPEIGAGGDYEQNLPAGAKDAVGGYAELYVLAGLEPKRYMIQVHFTHALNSCTILM
jgi:hypothetical protein